MPIDIVVMKAVSEENARHAATVRAQLDAHGVLAINMMSSPGSGKTALLEAAIGALRGELRIAVVEGDVFTALDAERIQRLGVPVVQLNTEGSCHLTAHMIEAVLPRLDLASIDLLAIENIGNLICPASFDLGEHSRVGCLSVAEGSDKADKYPRLFSLSHVNVITKVDLVPHVDFDVRAVEEKLRQLNPEAPVLVTSVRSGEGIDAWCDWLRSQVASLRNA